jgi:hypothetical protein
MPSKTKLKNAAIAARSAALPKIPAQLLDQLVHGPMTAESIQDMTTALKKALIERALGGELSHHLGYPPGGDKPAEAGNHRNGSTGKTVLTEDGPLRIEVPRDRQGSFEPLLIPKHERRFTGFDDKIVAMYARGMTVREIPTKGFATLDEARAWAASFVHWYNVDHRHSGIRYVSPAQRHACKDHAILAARHDLYTRCRELHPARWSGKTRNWSPIGVVTLNPERDSITNTHSDCTDKQPLAA